MSGQGRMRGRSCRGAKKLLGLNRYVHYLGYGHDFPVFACMYVCMYVYNKNYQTAVFLSHSDSQRQLLSEQNRGNIAHD